MSKGESLIKGKDAIAAAFADCYVDSYEDKWELLYKAVCEGYSFAEKDLGWHSVDESLPPVDEEVIALTDIITKDGLKVGFGRICFAHRPNPEGWDGKDIFTGKVTHHDVVTYDGWNIPGVKYWMPCPKIPEE